MASVSGLHRPCGLCCTAFLDVAGMIIFKISEPVNSITSPEGISILNVLRKTDDLMSSRLTASDIPSILPETLRN
jgi:hypothetical protein